MKLSLCEIGFVNFRSIRSFVKLGFVKFGFVK